MSDKVFQFSIAASADLQPLNPASVTISPFMANGSNTLPISPPSMDPGGHFLYYGDYGSGVRVPTSALA